MNIVLGATGHVGAAAASALLGGGHPVTVVTRKAARAAALEARGAHVMEADVLDPDALRAVFKTGRRALLINPPAAPSVDTDRAERRTVSSILKALEGSGLEFVVAQSTYGAQPCGNCGDLSVLYEFEAALADQAIPAALNRAAYYFSNWDALLDDARSQGILRTPFPPHFMLPMVAPQDVGRFAASLLTGEPQRRLHHCEGPSRYSAADVAAAFTAALGSPVTVVSTPPEKWIAEYRRLGFSPEAAASYARMTGVTLEGMETPTDPIRGSTALETYIKSLVRQADEKSDAD